jgi:ATPase subunit of ABC transporter with duplicated ATPase domains
MARTPEKLARQRQQQKQLQTTTTRGTRRGSKANTHDKNTKKISKLKTATNNNKKHQLTAPKKTPTDMRPQKNPKIRVVALIPSQNWSEYPLHKVFLHYIENLNVIQGKY